MLYKGIWIARNKKFSFKFKRITLNCNPSIYHWLWFDFYLYFKENHIAGVQFDENNKPCICGCSIKYLKEVATYYIFKSGRKKQEQLLFEQLNEEFPEYKGFIGLY